MKEKKYVLEGMDIPVAEGISEYISAQRLCELYELDPEECIFSDKGDRVIGYSKDLIVLRPRADCKYNPKELKPAYARR